MLQAHVGPRSAAASSLHCYASAIFVVQDPRRDAPASYSVTTSALTLCGWFRCAAHLEPLLVKSRGSASLDLDSGAFLLSLQREICL